ncbi:MAG: hypothetical protein KF799_06815 [Bdellovibrionales bacterium]|nr:hypothetical protein [Bdellovibrionales bacterium]
MKALILFATLIGSTAFAATPSRTYVINCVFDDDQNEIAQALEDWSSDDEAPGLLVTSRSEGIKRAREAVRNDDGSLTRPGDWVAIVSKPKIVHIERHGRDRVCVVIAGKLAGKEMLPGLAVTPARADEACLEGALAPD